MSGKELTFKLVMEADSKSFVTNVKQSEDVTKKVFATIKSEAEKVRVIDLVKDLHEATQEISNLGDKSSISASQIRDMSTQSQQKIGELKSELVAAQAELVRLSQSKAAPADIQNAINRVSDLEHSINDVKVAFGAYEATALNAMSGVDKATNKTISEIQKFTSVDLTEIVTETQNVTRAIESMGDGASVSTKEVQRIGQLGTTAIDALEKELISARAAWKALADSSDDVTLEELTAAKQRVTGLESALNLTENSMKEFNQATQQAIPIVDNLDNSLDQTNQGLKDTETFTQRASGEIEGLKTGFNTLTGVLGALGIGVTAGEIAQTADEFKSLSGRVNIAIGEHGNLQKAMDDVKNVAIATNSNLSATGDLYSRLTKIGQEMKWPQEQALALTETINKAIQVGGGSAESNAAAITQLQQSFSAGKLSGDELNSMLEQSPRLTQALADGIGITTGKLKEWGEQGKLTTEVVTKAILSQSEIISAEFAKFPTTIGASIENLKTAWTIYIGEADAANGVSAKVADAIKFVAQNLDTLVTTLTTVAQAFIAYKAIGMAAVFLEKANAIRGAQLAIATETTALVVNTQAQIANANAAKANATAHSGIKSSIDAGLPTISKLGTGLTGLVSRFGAYGAAAAAVATVGVIVKDGLVATGTAAGEGAAKLWLMATGSKTLEQSEKELAEQDAKLKKTQEDVSAAKERNALAAEKSRDKTYQLTEESKKLVAEFDELIKKGVPTKEALEKITNAMKFDSTKGINDSITALILLKDQGEITGDELQISLAKALNGKDLVVFGVNAKAAFTGTSKEAEKSAQLTEAVMKAALERTGFSAEQLQGRFSLAFQSASNDVQVIINNLDAYKAKGIDTGLALAANLNKAIDTAQTRAELDYAKAKFLELEKQGLITGEQVALGLGLIEKKAQQLPDALNPAIAAFNALGIKTKDQLNEAAEVAKRNFDVVSKSGQATADGIKQAYTTMLNAAIASGDKARIAAVQAKAASLGLQAQVDETGKASVKAMDEWTKSNDRVRDSAHGIGDGYRDAGRVAREEAKSSTEAWNEAVKASSDKFRAEMKRQGESLSKGIYDYSSYSKADVLSQLKSKGYSDKEAEKLAGSIWSEAMAADRDAKAEGLGKGGNPAMKALINQEFDAAAAKGLTTQWGTNKINDLLRQVSSDNLVSIGPSTKPVDVNSLAPNVNAPVPNTSASPTTRTVQNNISINGKTISIPVAEENQSNFNDFLSELEMLKKGM